jgi:hypothetical protein
MKQNAEEFIKALLTIAVFLTFISGIAYVIYRAVSIANERSNKVLTCSKAITTLEDFRKTTKKELCTPLTQECIKAETRMLEQVYLKCKK